jgi:hypothetical protein
MKIRAGSFLPKPLEPIGRQLGVEHRVLDIAVPEVMLDGTGIVAVVGELEPTRLGRLIIMRAQGADLIRPA